MHVRKAVCDMLVRSSKQIVRTDVVACAQSEEGVGTVTLGFFYGLRSELRLCSEPELGLS